MATKKLITNYLRLDTIEQIRESLSETANNSYYVFAGKHLAYASGDTVVPVIENTTDETLYNAYEEMVFGKRVAPTDVAIMAPRYMWTANTKYAAYRSDQDLTSQQFFVCVDNGATFDVFKCLDNNKNVASTVAPDPTQTSPDDTYYRTSDGYVWKYMYSVGSSEFNKFATTTRMPVVANGYVVANAVSGAIDFIDVPFRGSNYITSLSNTFISTDLRVGGDDTKYNIANNASSADDFYINSFIYLTGGTGSGQGRRINQYNVVNTTKTIQIATAFTIPPDTTTSYEITPAVTIIGNGEGAIARAIVDTDTANSISRIEVLARGNNYTWATATIVGNTGGVSNAATTNVVLGPKGGHGSKPEYELGADSLCFSVSFSNNELNTIPTQNQYRSIGLLKDPLFANVVITMSSTVGSFLVGETVIQANTGAVGIVNEWDGVGTLSLTRLSGVVQTGNTTNKYLVGQSTGANGAVSSFEMNGQAKSFDTFDQRDRYTFTPVSGTLQQDEVVFQEVKEVANAIFHSNTSSNLFLTHIKGAINTGQNLYGATSGASVLPTYRYPPDLVPDTGEVLYIENLSPITRSNTQSETIKIVLQF